jgi:predicted amidohydrolase YtcJ
MITGLRYAFRVLSKDILTIPEDEIPGAKVVYTIVGGKVMYP